MNFYYLRVYCFHVLLDVLGCVVFRCGVQVGGEVFVAEYSLFLESGRRRGQRQCMQGVVRILGLLS